MGADCRGDEAVWRVGGHGIRGSTRQPKVAQRRSPEIRQHILQLADWRTGPNDRTAWHCYRRVVFTTGTNTGVRTFHASPTRANARMTQ